MIFGHNYHASCTILAISQHKYRIYHILVAYMYNRRRIAIKTKAILTSFIVQH